MDQGDHVIVLKDQRRFLNGYKPPFSLVGRRAVVVGEPSAQFATIRATGPDGNQLGSGDREFFFRKIKKTSLSAL